MPAFPDYVRQVHAHPPERTGPPAAALLLGLIDEARAAPVRSAAPVSALRLLTALTSFVDDHDEVPVRELYEVDRALALLEALDGRRCYTVPEQLRLARTLAPGSSFESSLALHTVTRVLARGRDRRLHVAFALDLDERLRRGRAIAAFHPDDALGGDPLGDTYHYWANVAAGLYVASLPSYDPGRALVATMFVAGPTLMSTVRGGLFGNTLFFGNHARIDRMGFRHGLALAPRRSAAGVKGMGSPPVATRRRGRRR